MAAGHEPLGFYSHYGPGSTTFDKKVAMGEERKEQMENDMAIMRAVMSLEERVSQMERDMVGMGRQLRWYRLVLVAVVLAVLAVVLVGVALLPW